MAALNVARIHDVRISAENLPLVHMAKSPVLVSLVLQCFERAGRVVRVFRDPCKVRVQHSDVKKTGNRRRVFGGKILDDLRSGKALTMYRHTQLVIRKGLRLARTKNVNVPRRAELLDQFASGIMISVNKVNIDSGIF